MGVGGGGEKCAQDTDERIKKSDNAIKKNTIGAEI